jgi:hypothetical protein
LSKCEWKKEKNYTKFTFSIVEDGSMITQYGIMEVGQLVPDLVILTPTQVQLLEGLGEDKWHKIDAIVSKISIMLRMIHKVASETSRPIARNGTQKYTHG